MRAGAANLAGAESAEALLEYSPESTLDIGTTAPCAFFPAPNMLNSDPEDGDFRQTIEVDPSAEKTMEKGSNHLRTSVAEQSASSVWVGVEIAERNYIRQIEKLESRNSDLLAALRRALTESGPKGDAPVHDPMCSSQFAADDSRSNNLTSYTCTCWIGQAQAAIAKE